MPLVFANPKQRKLLQAEFDRIRLKERTPHEQLLERFLKCPEARKHSNLLASASSVRHESKRTLPTPSELLPWLQ
jgi:hypothetical protein